MYGLSDQFRVQCDSHARECLGDRAVRLGLLCLLPECRLIDPRYLRLGPQVYRGNAEPVADLLQRRLRHGMDAGRRVAAAESPAANAMEKQQAGAAAISSSGFVPFPCSNRDGNE